LKCITRNYGIARKEAIGLLPKISRYLTLSYLGCTKRRMLPLSQSNFFKSSDGFRWVLDQVVDVNSIDLFFKTRLDNVWSCQDAVLSQVEGDKS